MAKELPKWQSDFYALLYTKDCDLAIASNSEREVIIDATNRIKQLQEALEIAYEAYKDRCIGKSYTVKQIARVHRFCKRALGSG